MLQMRVPPPSRVSYDRRLLEKRTNRVLCVSEGSTAAEPAPRAESWPEGGEACKAACYCTRQPPAFPRAAHPV